MLHSTWLYFCKIVYENAFRTNIVVIHMFQFLFIGGKMELKNWPLFVKINSSKKQARWLCVINNMSFK
jgi:hypothetical protein